MIVAYMLTVTITLLPAGRMADIRGRKPIVVLGMAVLVVSSALCFLASSLETLIVSRVLQGIGGGLVLANVMAEITAVFPRQERRAALAINASILALAQVTGLVLGGLLIGQFGWPSLFLVILTISLAGLILSLAVLDPSPGPSPSTSLDPRGAILWIGAGGAPCRLIEHLSGRWPFPIGQLLLASVRPAPPARVHVRLARSGVLLRRGGFLLFPAAAACPARAGAVTAAGWPAVGSPVSRSGHDEPFGQPLWRPSRGPYPQHPRPALREWRERDVWRACRHDARRAHP
jgi:MFS family permease